ncbi:hypothetical protein MPRF_51650 [Mycolicibacterium parafortuitum]|uniref:GAF domain-containing protein n=1 Tax=Mycolicibacterium parafortuitum TaxID=39692 RepID=A0A7I7UDJ0_MYCPF|nr:GAF domain-containing protein [Mycolicibacterium parafortuitum]BBY78266.1 hypothetical protein MPRF_51650 [Mycolicibacterium parafortuitum]
MAWVPGFDERLDAALHDEAARAGEPVDMFVARAVAARIAVEMARRSDPALAEILDRIRSMDLAPPKPGMRPETGAVIADPERLQALHETGLLNARSGSLLDRVVEMAVGALAVPSAAVSLVDQDTMYVPSAIGLPHEIAALRQIPLQRSISRPIVTTGAAVITEDARTHPALMNHPMVLDGYVVGFAAMPITNPDGHTIGALAVWDSKPRPWTRGHLQILEDFTAVICGRIFDTSTD